MSEKKTRVVSDEEMRRQHEYIRRLNAEFLSRGRQPFAFVETYGCQQNNSDSERIKGMLADIGFAFCDKPDNADLYCITPVRCAKTPSFAFSVTWVHLKI